LNDDRTARDIDEEGARLHELQFARADHAARLRRQRAGEDNNVARSQKILARYGGYTARKAGIPPRMSEDTNPETLGGDRGDGAADIAHADDAHGAPGYLAGAFGVVATG